MERLVSGDMKHLLEELRSLARLAAQSASEESLCTRVMELFRAENLEGLSALMAEQRMAAEFRDELQALADRFAARMYGRDHRADVFESSGSEGRR